MDYKDRKDFIRLYLGEDMNRKEMAKYFDVSGVTIDYWRKKHNITSKGSAKLHRTFVREVYNLVGCDYTVFSYYKNAREKVDMKCNICGNIFQIRPDTFLKGNRCPECRKNKMSKKFRRSDKEFKEIIKNLVDDEYVFLEEYVNSQTKILCKHNIENCGHEWKVRPQSFIHGQIRCPRCRVFIPHNKKTHKEFNNNLKSKYGEGSYKILDTYVDAKTKIKFKCLECDNVFKTTPTNILSGRGCPECSKRKAILKMRKSQKEFLKEVKEIHGDKYKIISKYKTNMDKVKIKCEICGHVWKIRAGHLLQGHGCPKCANVKKKTTKEFKEEVNNLVGEEFKVVSDYNGCKEKIIIYHQECNEEFITTPDYFLQNLNCNNCSVSKGENKIKRWLIENNINYDKEFTFKDCLSPKKGRLRFDFVVYNDDGSINCLIEFQGEQHINPNHYFYQEGTSFGYRKKCDQIKKDFCKTKNLKLLEIYYWQYDLVEDILQREISENSENKYKYKQTSFTGR